jgi:antitoxin (DNA-binding transcriptional repressor) of toxin-antitoxin stability system
MTTITLEEAQAHLASWIAQLQPGEEIVIVERDHPVARLIAEPGKARRPRVPGSARGQLIVVQEDDEHLRDFGAPIS